MAQGDILKLLKKRREMTVKEISRSININIYSVYENLRRLRKQGGLS
jgi:Sugar-specific transcriptional regulator TrmB.